MPSYFYRPLESERHIRLLKLSSRDNRSARDGLIDSITHFHLADVTWYEPVSYAWAGYKPKSYIPEETDGPVERDNHANFRYNRRPGQGSEHGAAHHQDSASPQNDEMYKDAGNLDQELEIGTGQTLIVSKSLLIALPYLHKVSYTRWLWIDQLCINQEDDYERSNQVRIMHMIYSQGFATIFWLGEDTRDMDFLRGVFRDMNTMERRFAKTCRLHYGNCYHPLSKEQKAIFQRAAPAYLCKGDPTYWPRVTTALTELFERPWFTRMWILQEWFYTYRGLFVTGAHNFSAANLMRLCYINPGHFFTLSDGSAAMEYLCLQSAMPSSLSYYLRQRCEEILAGKMHCSDPRDYVYGILNVVEKEPCLPRVDYSLSPIQVFVAATRYCFESEGDLDILCLTQPWAGTEDHMELNEDGPNMPTWAIDMARPAGKSPDYHPPIHYDLNRSPFRACGERRLPRKRDTTWDVLSCRGKVIDTITWLLPCDRFNWLGAKELDIGLDKIMATLNEREMARTNQETTTIPRLLRITTDGLRLKLDELFNPKIEIETTGTTTAGPEPPAETASASEAQNADPLPRNLTDEDIAAAYTNAPLPHPLHPKQEHNLRETLLRPVVNRAIAETSTDALGLVSKYARVGDSIAILHGCPCPVVLRRHEDDSAGKGVYRFLGTCYLEGAMFGEKVSWGDEEADSFLLV